MELLAEAPPLQTFYVYLTSGCNCACRHCWIVPESTAAGVFLAPPLLRSAIEQALPLGLQSLKWTGGEPTLHPEFPQLLDLQKEYGLTASLETNGMLVDDRLAGLLQRAGVSSVSVSLDGATAATHDAIRGVKSGFARTCQGVRALVAVGYRPELILTLQRVNVGELPEFITLAETLGAGSVKLNILQPLLRGADLDETGEGLAVGELIALARDLQGSRQAGGIRVELDIPLAFRPLSRFLDPGGCGTCTILNIMGILPGGEYALCGIGQQVPELAMGRIATASLREIWEHQPILNALRAGLPGDLQGICAECLVKAVCLGSCVAVNYRQSGNLLAPHWFCMAADAAGLFPAQRRL